MLEIAVKGFLSRIVRFLTKGATSLPKTKWSRLGSRNHQGRLLTEGVVCRRCEWIGVVRSTGYMELTGRVFCVG